MLAFTGFYAPHPACSHMTRVLQVVVVSLEEMVLMVNRCGEGDGGVGEKQCVNNSFLVGKTRCTRIPRTPWTRREYSWMIDFFQVK